MIENNIPKWDIIDHEILPYGFYMTSYVVGGKHFVGNKVSGTVESMENKSVPRVRVAAGGGGSVSTTENIQTFWIKGNGGEQFFKSPLKSQIGIRDGHQVSLVYLGKKLTSIHNHITGQYWWSKDPKQLAKDFNSSFLIPLSWSMFLIWLIVWLGQLLPVPLIKLYTYINFPTIFILWYLHKFNIKNITNQLRNAVETIAKQK